MTFRNGKPLPVEQYEIQIKERRKNNLILFGLVCVIVFGLLVISGTPASAVQFNESLPGERNVGDTFEFTMHNASGLEDLTHHFTVYSSKIYDADEPYSYWSVYFGQYLNLTPDPGKRWLFVWVQDWIEGSPTWSYGSDRFTLSIWGNVTVSAEPVQMEDVAQKQGKKLKPAIIRGVTYGHPVQWRDYNYYGDPYGWRDGIEMPYIDSGKSNAWSGWIKYQVPGAAELKDIRVMGWFMNHGVAYWNLVPVSFVQVEPRSVPVPIAAPVQQGVIRTSDRPGAPVIDGRERG